MSDVKTKFQKQVDNLKIGDYIWVIKDACKVKRKFRLKFKKNYFIPLLIKTKITKRNFVVALYVNADKIIGSFFLQEGVCFFNESLARKKYNTYLKAYKSDLLSELKDIQFNLKENKNELKIINSLLKQNQR